MIPTSSTKRNRTLPRMAGKNAVAFHRMREYDTIQDIVLEDTPC